MSDIVSLTRLMDALKEHAQSCRDTLQQPDGGAEHDMVRGEIRLAEQILIWMGYKKPTPKRFPEWLRAEKKENEH